MTSKNALFLSMGSNLGDREANLHHGLRLLDGEVHLIGVSSLYETTPVGVSDQPAFLNLAAAAETDRDPANLLRAVKFVEEEVGRRPTFRWGPRVLDIDILLYGDRVLETPELTIPHREMVNRAFVLVPLAEIAPEVVHPVLGETVAGLAQGVGGRAGVQLVGSSPDVRALLGRTTTEPESPNGTSYGE